MSIEKLLEEYKALNPNDKIIFMNKVVHWDNREEDQKDLEDLSKIRGAARVE